MESTAECPGVAGGVADEQQFAVAGRHHRVNSLIDPFAHPLSLIHHDQHIGRVEPLKLVCLVGGEPERKAVVGNLETGAEHPATEEFGRAAVEAANLAPQNVAHLPGGGSGGEDDGGGVAGEEPEHGAGGGKAFSESVSGLDGDALVAGEGFEDFFLLAPELDAEDIAGEDVWGAAATLHNQALVI